MENRINRQMDLKVEVAYEEGNPYVNLSGEMDVYTSPRVKQAALNLIAEGKHHLIFDLTRVDYIDTAGLGVLVGILKRAREVGGNVELCYSDQVKKVFEITGLDKIFIIRE
jgi:anti-sigma B factor antagonist